MIDHADIIGKSSRQLVLSAKGTAFRILEPSLAEYVKLTPRIVTPIYACDANLIVSLLDLHVDTPSIGLNPEPPLEILEAGTGHGALTLHLSRAIHAANPPRPRTPAYVSSQGEEAEANEETENQDNEETEDQDDEDAVYLGESVSDLQDAASETWKQDRRAIIHSLDIHSRHSKHAKKIVGDFRHGMYAGNVDFHVGDVSDWIAAQRTSRKTEEPFLSHVILDLPNADTHLANIATALHVNGLLGVFNPSITQIAACVDLIREQRLPYLLHQVVELGAATIREWDVRNVKPRASLKKPESQPPSESTSNPEAEHKARDGELAEDLAQREEKWAMVCRPKVGQQVVGGGFLALFKRMKEPDSREQT
ncbi:hypothetical protein BDW02DRAFT_636148 [Decorospora gaudefroyi]|uniref:tRNA (adenine(58)-N(1))-methyltransferase catalytic subunit TRM61 n=1 Tax=Decorospora gaudefroyi TaxID=184978 RepID=A0A6A5KRF3_9PLEO|nr:hypothetical protein BDW02DRAFT_636148 [Decorospora gaudefroyi]